MVGLRSSQGQHRSNWPYPRVIAHRGASSVAPENTLAAMRAASQGGFRGVEFDVTLSSDAIPLLIHDETLDRTTNGKGNVADFSWPQLATLDAGRWFDAAFEGERLPSYSDAARLCIDLDLWANVEIKPAAGSERETGRLVASMSTALWQKARVAPLLSSFSTGALEAAAHAAPGLARGLLVDAIPPNWRETLTRLDCVSLHCEFRNLTLRQVRDVKNAGYGLVCYTVNDPEKARELFEWGLDAIITDRVDLKP